MSRWHAGDMKMYRRWEVRWKGRDARLARHVLKQPVGDGKRASKP